MKRTFVLGDVHGAYRALRQVLDRAAFDYEHDQLIFLGDVCDGWPQTCDCIEELLRIKELVYLLGNHDWWMLEWIKHDTIEEVWYSQGGKATLDSYHGNKPPLRHQQLLMSARTSYIINNRLFVHARILLDEDILEQSIHTLLWDRSLARKVIEYANDTTKKFTPFDEVYLGHTPVAGNKPLQCGEVFLMDTGAGWSGVLSLMNIDTKEIFASDPVPLLYPGVEGRVRRK